MLANIVVLALACCAIVFLFSCELLATKRRVRHICAERDQVSYEEWLKIHGLEQLSARQRLLIHRVLQIAGDCYVLEPTYIHIEDSFRKELGLRTWFFDGDDAFELFQERLFNELNIEWDSSWQTKGDVISSLLAASDEVAVDTPFPRDSSI